MSDLGSQLLLCIRQYRVHKPYQDCSANLPRHFSIRRAPVGLPENTVPFTSFCLGRNEDGILTPPLTLPRSFKMCPRERLDVTWSLPRPGPVRLRKSTRIDCLLVVVIQDDEIKETLLRNQVLKFVICTKRHSTKTRVNSGHGHTFQRLGVSAPTVVLLLRAHTS
jgi:hypothetical protein